MRLDILGDTRLGTFRKTGVENYETRWTGGSDERSEFPKERRGSDVLCVRVESQKRE